MHDSKINNHQSQVQASNENNNAQALTRSWEKDGWKFMQTIKSQVQALNENNNAQDTEEIDKLDMENRAIKIGIGRELMINQHDRFKSRRQHSHAHIGRPSQMGSIAMIKINDISIGRPAQIGPIAMVKINDIGMRGLADP